MRLSLNLLKKIVTFKTNDISKIEREFTDKVAEIDSVIIQDRWLEKVFVWVIKKISAHPNADKMQVTETQVWDELLQIVCWAKNIYEWQRVPVAIVWALLPWWFEITKANKRWVDSCGMICSKAELWLEDESEWIMELPKDAPLWKKFSEYYWLDDVIFDIENKSITNRPDLFSHNSWAKEAVAIWIATYKNNSPWLENNFNFINKKTWEIISKKKSKLSNFPLRFSFDDWVVSRMQWISLSWVNNTKSPEWLQKVLKSVDIRPISLLVDATNFAMVLTWVPTHAFDLSKINWNKINMRLSKVWEKVITLDWIERIMPGNVIVMNDDKHVFDLCWIMWWENSWVDESTENVWIHVPVYHPILIRRAAISLNHRSDASAIYEKKVPDSCVPYALECVLKIILDSCPKAEISSKIFEYFPHKNKLNKPILLDIKKINSVIWHDIPEKKVKEILTNLWFEVSVKKWIFNVIVSKNRYKDINIDDDLIEEIARVYGLQNIKSEAPISIMKIAEVSDAFFLEKKIKDNLSMQWLIEVLNYAFLWNALLTKCDLPQNNFVEVSNPISEDMSKMRKSLIPYLLDNVSKNKLFSDKFWIFELARVFDIKNSESKENKNIWLSFYAYDFFEAKSVLENLFDYLWISVLFSEIEKVPVFCHPGQCAEIVFQWKNIWFIWTLHPKLGKNFDLDKNTIVSEIDFDLLSANKIGVKKYKEFSRFPWSVRDVNFVIDRKKKVYDIMRWFSKFSEIITDVNLVDVYEWDQIWENNKSITIRISYGHKEKTLSDEEVNIVHNLILDKAQKEWLKLR